MQTTIKMDKNGVDRILPGLIRKNLIEKHGKGPETLIFASDNHLNLSTCYLRELLSNFETACGGWMIIRAILFQRRLLIRI